MTSKITILRASRSGAPNMGSTVLATWVSKPCADEIESGHADDIAPFQLSEEIAVAHGTCPDTGAGVAACAGLVAVVLAAVWFPGTGSPTFLQYAAKRGSSL